MQCIKSEPSLSKYYTSGQFEFVKKGENSTPKWIEELSLLNAQKKLASAASCDASALSPPPHNVNTGTFTTPGVDGNNSCTPPNALNQSNNEIFSRSNKDRSRNKYTYWKNKKQKALCGAGGVPTTNHQSSNPADSCSFLVGLESTTSSLVYSNTNNNNNIVNVGNAKLRTPEKSRRRNSADQDSNWRDRTSSKKEEAMTSTTTVVVPMLVHNENVVSSNNSWRTKGERTRCV